MLEAEKDNLRSSFSLRMLSIRERELDFFTRNFQHVAQLATLLAGFAYSGLIYTKYIDHNLCGEHEVLCSEFTYPIAITATMCLSLFVMWACTLVTMLAPGLALRGPDGSLHKCVDIVVQEYEYAVFLFACSLVVFVTSAALWAFAKSPHWSTAMALFIICVLTLYLICVRSRIVHKCFYIKSGQIVTGRWKPATQQVRRYESLSTMTALAPARNGVYTRLTDEDSSRESRGSSEAEPVAAGVDEPHSLQPIPPSVQIGQCPAEASPQTTEYSQAEVAAVSTEAQSSTEAQPKAQCLVVWPQASFRHLDDHRAADLEKLWISNAL